MVWARRLALGVLLVAILLATGHMLAWRWMGDQLAAGFATWTESRRAEGWRVGHGAPQRGGWPLAATLTVPDFRLEGAALPFRVDWRAEAVVLRIAPPRLDRLVLEMPGRHTLRLGGVVMPFTADRLNVTLPIEGDAGPDEAVVAARRLRFDTRAGTVEVRIASAAIEMRGTATGGGPAAMLRVSAGAMTLPPDLPGADRLGREVERLGLTLALNGSVPPGRDPIRRAEAWRNRGGTLDVHALELRWGEVAAIATATLRLNGVLQPEGTGVLRLTGGEALLDAAGAAGLLAPFNAAAARVALRVLGRATPEGGPARVELPLALQDRSLSLSRIAVARLPALDWAAPGADAVTGSSSPSRD